MEVTTTELNAEVNTEVNTEVNEDFDNNEYDILYKEFKDNYSIEELLNLCEKHKLSIYGNREIISDRLAYYFSENHRRNGFNYRLKECWNKLLLRFNNYYYEIK
jgi:hypothetical protein